VNITSKSDLKLSKISATREDYDIVIRLFGMKSHNNQIELNFSPENYQIKMFMSGNMSKFHQWTVEKEIAVLQALERVCSQELN